ncbi:hypothetical protein HY469_00690, partial [Candidatus Roizmanbacteria bacterium]|nr:hypothetical protein [Candidatus Roizmanbacteria bacterium]
TVYVADMSAVDLSDESDVAHFVMDFYIPDATNITSFDLFWSDESSVTPSTKSKYWTKNVTTQLNGGSFQNGWNVLDFDWASATKTGSPGSSAIVYLEIRVNYSASQTDDTDFRFNYIRAVIPEVVDVRYSTAYIAENTSGTLIDEIGATNDVMLFSQMDTKFMRTVIAGCLYELFGDDNTKGGTKESLWERRYTREKVKLLTEYPPRIKRVERRVNIRSTQRLQFV